jgi:subtilase family serine protease
MLVLLGWLGLVAQAVAQPDLIVTTPINCPSSMTAGTVYTLSATIRNQGTGGAQFGYIGAYLSRDNAWDATDVYLQAVGTNLLGGVNSVTLTISVLIPATTAAGSCYVVFVADPLDMERESNEQNNVLTVPVTMTSNGPAPLPDVKPWRPSLALTSSPPGGRIGVFTFVMNQGLGGATNIEVGYYLSADTLFSTTDVILGTSLAGTLAPNVISVTTNPVLTIPVSTTPGPYYVLYVADHLNRIVESDEANNSRALAITITGTTTATQGPGGQHAARLYPNPAVRGQGLHLELGAAAGATVVVVRNTLGQEVLRQRLDGSTGVLDVSRLAAGPYLVEAAAGGRVALRQRLLID